MGGPDHLLRFQVLGPLRVWRHAEPVDLGPIQRRVVLAVLLLNANQPIGRQQLIDAVWGEAAPRWAVNLLQRDMSGLRRALEPERTERSAPSCLKWTDAGYLLDLSHSSLDLAAFDELVERAKKARSGGKDAEAARLLGSLWGSGRDLFVAGCEARCWTRNVTDCLRSGLECMKTGSN